MSFNDPKIRFWIGVALTIATGIGTGGIALKGAFPDTWIPYITAWANIIGFFGTAILTALNGAGMTTTARIASAAADPSVSKILTSNEVANNSTFVDNDKVVSK